MFKFFKYILLAAVSAMSLYLLLCLNVFSVPVGLVSKLVCGLFRIRKPKFKRYGTLFYPSWSEGQGKTFIGDIQEQLRQEEIKRRRYERQHRLHPFESMFFD